VKDVALLWYLQTKGEIESSEYHGRSFFLGLWLVAGFILTVKEVWESRTTCMNHFGAMYVYISNKIDRISMFPNFN
jgi:hypothetical protein